MIVLLSIFLSTAALANSVPTTPLPISLKFGYSSVLEFDEVPTQVVLGDPRSFQVEKLKHSIVVRPLVDEYTTNMFVYFRKQNPRLFILTVNSDVEPTLYKKFESMKLIAEKKMKKVARQKRYQRKTTIRNSYFDKNKDFLTVEIAMSADSKASIKPLWEKTRLRYKAELLKPEKLWAERQIVQKDSLVKARFVFKRPDLPRNLANTDLLIPLEGHKTPVKLTLKKGG